MLRDDRFLESKGQTAWLPHIRKHRFRREKVRNVGRSLQKRSEIGPGTSQNDPKMNRGLKFLVQHIHKTGDDQIGERHGVISRTRI
jgi:hypothetical protein